MNVLCPNCQKMLQVPDQFAGQAMKCPLCGGAFTVPASSGTTAMPPASASTGPAATPAGYEHTASLVIQGKALSWAPAAGLFLVFVLMFFPWLEAGVSVSDNRHAASGWQTAFGDMGSAVGMLYALLLMVGLLLAVAAAVIPMVPPASLPPAVQPFMQWRSASVAAAALLLLLLLLLEFATSFGPESYDKHPVTLGKDQTLHLSKTTFLFLVLICNAIAALTAGLDAWNTRRGPGKPAPRIDIHW